jgi:hypothetical protein
VTQRVAETILRMRIGYARVLTRRRLQNAADHSRRVPTGRTTISGPQTRILEARRRRCALVAGSL